MKKERTNSLILSFALLCLALILTPATLHADTRYVSDQLIITMRRGAGSGYMIVKSLKTGTSLKILQEKGNYLEVATADGKHGWVLKQYITTDIPKTAVIGSLKREIKKLKAARAKLVKERNIVQKELGEGNALRKDDAKSASRKLNKANNQIYSLNKTLKETTRKYNTLVKNSGEVLNITNERDMLNKTNARLITENRDLTVKNDRLSKKNAFYWFLAGVGVFFFGWIIGQFSKRKRTLY